MVDGKIQAFPAAHWREEFAVAERLGIQCMEWTLDQEGLHENPFMTPEGQREIAALCTGHGVRIPTLTGDCFMQAPFWKVDGDEYLQLLDDAAAVIRACRANGTGLIVVPLVDNGSITAAVDEERLRAGLGTLTPLLRETGVRIAFESDFPPARLKEFIASLPEDLFGINYDIGNSAALGFDYAEELAAYADRIIGVHVKDRLLGGTTVPLGTGAANLEGCLGCIARSGYGGIYVLQTARAAEGDHAGVLARYAEMTRQYVELAVCS